MNVSFNECKAIADTLPIGIYAKRRIPCTVSETEECSFYSPITDTITISYPQLSSALAKTPDSEDKEVAIRSMEYHEVSHAILTGWKGRVSNQFNIFEDERIETILNDYYLDVDFAKQVYRINGIESNADLNDPKDAMDAFYQLVRFHKGDADLLQRVAEIIRKYAKLSMTRSCVDGYDWYDYNQDINNLYEEVKKRMGESGSDSSDGDEQQDGDGSDGDGSDGDGSGNGSGKSKPTAGTGADGRKTPVYVDDVLEDDGSDGEQGRDGSEENKEEEQSDGDGSDGDGSDGSDGDKKSVSKGTGIGKGHGQTLGKIFSENTTPAYNDDLYKKFEMIISNFNKKNNSGCAMTGYSGVFNPRQAGREDCRFFERKATVNGNNKFGTFHLNLFLDNSGSFSENMEIVNGMLGALLRLEKTNKNFSFNVVHCGSGEELITDKNKYGLNCDDGTSLDYDAIEIFKKLQKSNTYNYNIVLYDGSCYNRYYADAFKAFNYNNCTIISDPDNEKQINKYAPSAKRIITQNYTENLLDNITATLARAFR